MGFFDRFKKKAEPAKPSKPAKLDVTPSADAVYAAATGKLIPMEEIPDPVFASGAMGRAVGIQPSDGIVYAPVSGKITAAMPQAQGLLSNDGVEVLIHVGIDTVNMKGDGFEVYTQKEEMVQAGDPLLKFDRAKVAAAGYNDVVITVITNTDDYAAVEPVGSGDVQAGTQVLKITK